MKNILFVISTLTGGGAERTVSSLSEHFGEDIRCTVLLNSTSEDDYSFDGEIISLGMKPAVKKTMGYQIVAAFKRYRKLKELKSTRRYNAVISFMESANFLNVLTGGKNCKTILSVRNVLSEEYTGIYKIILICSKILYRKADYVVALSEFSRIDLIHNIGVPGKKVITIYNGYDLTQYKYRQHNGRTSFITMGRLVPQKGQWHLIRAFSEVVKVHPEARLIILGQGQLENTLKELIEAYNLDKNVEMVGFVNNSEDYLAEADCFVFPSVYEGFGNALIEALMNGLPVIVSDYSVAREIAAPELDKQRIIQKVTETSYGILTPRTGDVICNEKVALDDAEYQMAEAMIGFIDGKVGKQYDDKNRLECLSRFSIEHVIAQWTELI